VSHYNSKGEYGQGLKERANESTMGRKRELDKMYKADHIDFEHAPRRIREMIKKEYRHDDRTKMHLKNSGPLL